MTRPRGTGSVRSRNGWLTIKYYVDGKPIREAAHTKDPAAAQALLNKRLGEIARGGMPQPRRERARMGELLDDFLTDLRTNARRDYEHAEIRADRLRSEFGNRRAFTLRVDDIRRYIDQRQTEQASNATINRELAVLRRAFNLGVEADKVDRIPKIRRLREKAPRAGFLERDRFELVRSMMKREVVRDIATVAYWLGWRLGELLALEPRQVDVKRKCIVIEPGVTKGGEGRVVYPPSEAWGLIEKWHGRRAEKGRIARTLFHRGGKPIKSIRDAWRAACWRAGMPAAIFHDLRRTAARNMVRNGIPETVAMKITGHRTRSIFDRYNIVSDEDMVAAARKMENGRTNGRTKKGAAK